MHLTEVTWRGAAEADAAVGVVPVGSVEQHGPHAPLGTDFFAAKAVARAGAESANSEAVVGPTIPVGIAAEHRHFPGTLWVSESTFRAYVREICASFAHHGWDRLVLVNGHGGNVGALRELCGKLTREETAYAVPFTWFDAVDTADLDVEMGHGGAVETSLIRSVHPELVETDRFEEAAAGAATQWGEWHSGVNLAYDTAEFSENGVVGDPTASSPEIGEKLLNRAAEKLASLLDVVADRDWSRPENK